MEKNFLCKSWIRKLAFSILIAADGGAKSSISLLIKMNDTVPPFMLLLNIFLF
jgi:hypothetical protein